MAQNRAPVSVGVSLNVSGNIEDNPLEVLRGLTNAQRSVEAKLSEAVQEARRQVGANRRISGHLQTGGVGASYRMTCSMSRLEDLDLHRRGARDREPPGVPAARP